MRDRFGLIQRLDFFSEGDLVSILDRASRLWNIKIEKDALKILSGSSRGTARVGLLAEGLRERRLLAGGDPPEALQDPRGAGSRALERRGDLQKYEENSGQRRQIGRAHV